ncbi:MAG: hypothetical protein Q8P67_10840 [archaeon]|nr:hypothetical protein [archaeon]
MDRQNKRLPEREVKGKEFRRWGATPSQQQTVHSSSTRSFKLPEEIPHARPLPSAQSRSPTLTHRVVSPVGPEVKHAGIVNTSSDVGQSVEPPKRSKISSESITTVTVEQISGAKLEALGAWARLRDGRRVHLVEGVARVHLLEIRMPGGWWEMRICGMGPMGSMVRPPVLWNRTPAPSARLPQPGEIVRYVGQLAESGDEAAESSEVFLETFFCERVEDEALVKQSQLMAIALASQPWI